MKKYNFAKLTLSALVAAQLLNIEAYAESNPLLNLDRPAGSQFTETLLTNDEQALNDPNLQIGKPIIKEISEQEALELMNEAPANEMDSKLTTIPMRPSKQREEIDLPELSDLNTEAGLDLRRIQGGAALANSSQGQFYDEYEDDDSEDYFGNQQLGYGAGRMGQYRYDPRDPMNKANGTIMVIDKLVAVGKQIAPLIQKGVAKSTNNPMDAISVLPKPMSKEFINNEMENWSSPKTKSFTVSYPGILGGTVVKFVYSVTFQYGGTYNGKGKYLTGVRSFAKRISVDFGYDLDARSKLVQITNVGKNGKVIAGAMIEMQYTVKNFARTRTNVDSFFVRGDGIIEMQKN